MPKGVYPRSEETKQRLAAMATTARKGKKSTPKLTCSKGHSLSGDNILKEGSRIRCKTCKRETCNNWSTAHKDKVREKSKKWSKANPDKTRILRRNKVLSQYGLTIESVEAMLNEQDSKCANPGCLATSPGGRHHTWHVDHDHKTGKARGLLCNTCNVGLGMLGEDENRILGLIKYLRRYEENTCLDEVTGQSLE